jgi:multisubunit Na+/H+ antiporter MnhE subunit
VIEPIDPKDGGYGEIGCLLTIASCLVGAGVAIVIQFFTASAGIQWSSIGTGAVAGLIVAFVASDPLLNALGRFKVPRRLGEPIFFIAEAVMPGAVTIAVALLSYGVVQ